MNDRAGSINSCLESDLFPSTPLTDEQMRHADSVLKDDFEGGVIPLNRIPEEDNSPDLEIDGIDPITDEGYIRAFMHNAAEQEWRLWLSFELPNLGYPIPTWRGIWSL